MRFQRAERDVSTNVDIADEVEVGRLGYFFEAFFAILDLFRSVIALKTKGGGNAHLDLGVIGRNTIAHKPERYWQTLIHVDYDFAVPTHQPTSCIEACWARADDGEPEGLVGLRRSAVHSASSMVPNAPSRNRLRPMAEVLQAVWADVRLLEKVKHGVGVKSEEFSTGI